MSIVIPIELIPIPQTLFALTFAIIGWELGDAFSTKDSVGLDEAMKETGYWNKLKGLSKFIASRMLHFFHHYWLGMLLMVFCSPWATEYPVQNWIFGAFYWFGYGLFVEDGQYHLRGFIQKIRGNNEETPQPPAPNP